MTTTTTEAVADPFAALPVVAAELRSWATRLQRLGMERLPGRLVAWAAAVERVCGEWFGDTGEGENDG